MAAIPERLLLTNVPKVEFYSGGLRCPEDIPFPAVMRALVEYFKDEEIGCKFCVVNPQKCKIRCSYSFFIGVSGVASFLNWKPGWAGDNVEDMRFTIMSLAFWLKRAGMGHNFLLA